MAQDDYYRKRALKRLGVAAIMIAIGLVAVLIFLRSDSFQKISSLENSAARIANEELPGNFSAPTPLVSTSTAGQSANTATSTYTLTRNGVITDTNAERKMNGKLPALKEDATLDNIASLRLKDMFDKQYFAHVSPSSSSAETVAITVGYDYISLGENLALGNFAGDQGVVTAWMNSPGHRANILNTHYTEIGVAVGYGKFQGSNVWIAVQVFGRPASDCPGPDASLKSDIDNMQDQITQMQSELQSMQAQMDAMQPQSGDDYNQAVNNYNTLVDQYNAVVAQVKSEIAQYNGEVSTYNSCIGS